MINSSHINLLGDQKNQNNDVMQTKTVLKLLLEKVKTCKQSGCLNPSQGVRLIFLLSFKDGSLSPSVNFLSNDCLTKCGWKENVINDEYLVIFSATVLKRREFMLNIYFVSLPPSYMNLFHMYVTYSVHCRSLRKHFPSHHVGLWRDVVILTAVRSEIALLNIESLRACRISPLSICHICICRKHWWVT